MDYCQFSDEKIISLIKSGDNEFLHILINRYLGIIQHKASLLCPFADIDDMVQEGIIALYSAINVYDASLSSFSTFANLCIERGLITAYRKLFNKKQVPKTETVPFEEYEKPIEITPESLIIEKEECMIFIEKIKNTLSDFEYRVLCEFLNNTSYDAVAKKLSVDNKAVNNAMVRLRNKIKAIK